jgi:HlyD family secretion protein
MKRKALLAIAGAAALVGYIGWRTWSSDRAAEILPGYVEGDLLYMSAPVSGPVAALHVREGARVPLGAPLFAVDPEPMTAQRLQAEAGVEAALAAARDARKGQRAPELAIVEAQRAQAQAALRQARADYERVRTLTDRGIYARARLDDARAAFDTALAQAREADRRLEVAELGARADAIAAADARTAQAAGALAESEARLKQLRPVAPEAARVQEVYYQPGEWAAANQPVVALLPDRRVKLRFFVPETEVQRYRPGRSVAFACDGCAVGQRAVIDYVSARPEYTPPVIYSRDSRDRLVFRVEARPERPAGLQPGLPVDVSRLRDEGAS